MSSALDEVLGNLEATVAASARSASLKLERAGAKKRFIELAAPLLDAAPKRRCLETAHAPSGVEDETSKPKGETTPPKSQVDVAAFYQNMIDQCEMEDKKFKEEGAKSLESVRELRRVYLYGLQKVSKLQDLREAPDALMPGNFVKDRTSDDKK